MSRQLAVVALALAACSGQTLEGTGIDCDPIAFQLDNEVWVLSAGVEARLSEPGLLGFNPAVSSDGSRVAFTSGEQGGGDLDLYVINSDGSDRHLVWNGENLTQSSVDWSPDNTTLVIDQYSEQNGIDVPLQIFIIPSDGSGQPLQLTDGKPNGKPKWGPDDRIVFLSLRDADDQEIRDSEAQEIYSMRSDGSDPVNLTRGPARDVLAETSPDGSTIVFASDRSGTGDFDIWTMNTDGSNPRQLTDRAERETNPTWSSDGKHILYRSDRTPAGLWYMNPDGSNQAPLLEDVWLASCP